MRAPAALRTALAARPIAVAHDLSHHYSPRSWLARCWPAAAPRWPCRRWPPGDPKTPGTPAWWKKHRRRPKWCRGHGYRVEGVDGYFDDNGVPINSRVAKVVDKPEGSGGLLNDVGFQKGVGDFKEKLGLGPDQHEAQRQFELGEANFRGQHFDEAADNFKAAAAGWPDSALAQDALFAYAESLFFAESYPKANNAYEELLRKYPNSRHLDKAITRQFAIARYWEQ